MLETYLKQIKVAADSGLHQVALSCALSVPDILGALATPDGRATSFTYIAWFDTNVAPYFHQGEIWDELTKGLEGQISIDGMDRSYPYLSGEDAYGFRCSLLHQGRSQPHKGKYDRILFVKPEEGTHWLMSPSGDVLLINVTTFCHRVIEAGIEWLETHRTDPLVVQNLEHTLQERPSGFCGFHFVTVIG